MKPVCDNFTSLLFGAAGLRPGSHWPGGRLAQAQSTEEADGGDLEDMAE